MFREPLSMQKYLILIKACHTCLKTHYIVMCQRVGSPAIPPVLGYNNARWKALVRVCFKTYFICNYLQIRLSMQKYLILIKACLASLYIVMCHMVGTPAIPPVPDYNNARWKALVRVYKNWYGNNTLVGLNQHGTIYLLFLSCTLLSGWQSTKLICLIQVAHNEIMLKAFFGVWLYTESNWW